MSSQDEQRIADLENRVRTLELHVRHLERIVAENPGVRYQPKTSRRRTHTGETGDTVQSTGAPPVQQRDFIEDESIPPAPTSSAPPGPDHPDWEVQFGKVWMPRIFIIVLLIGVIWGFSAAVQAGWINRPVRIGLGYIVTAGLIVYGEMQMKKHRDAFGQVLLGGATALAILTTFAASTLYGIIGPTPAFALDVLFVLCTVYLSLRHHSEALAVVSMTAAILVPFLIKNPHSNLTLFILYESVMSFGFGVYALIRKYIYLGIVSLTALHAAFVALSLLKHLHAPAFVIPVTIQVAGLFGVILYSEKRLTKGLKTSALALFWTLLGFATLWMYGELEANSTHIYLWVVVAVLLFTLIWSWRKHETAFLLAVAPFWIYLSLALFAVLSNRQFLLAFVLVSAASVAAGIYSNSRTAKTEGYVFFVLCGLILLAAYDPFFGHRVRVIEHVTWALYTLCAFVLVYAVVIKMERPLIQQIGTWLCIVVLGLYLTHESQALTYHLSRDTQHLVLSLVWIVYAIASIGFGMVYGSRPYRRFGILFLFVTLSKLILIDIPAVTLVIRAILFIALGGLGVLASRIFYRKK